MCGQIARGQGTLIRKEPPVHFPIFSLVTSATSGLGRAKDPQQILAGELLEIMVAPAATDQLGEQLGELGDVLQSLGHGIDPIEIASDAHMIDAHQLDHVVDVVEHPGKRRHVSRRLGGRRAVVGSANDAHQLPGIGVFLAQPELPGKVGVRIQGCFPPAGRFRVDEREAA